MPQRSCLRSLRRLQKWAQPEPPSFPVAGLKEDFAAVAQRVSPALVEPVWLARLLEQVRRVGPAWQVEAVQQALVGPGLIPVAPVPLPALPELGPEMVPVQAQEPDLQAQIAVLALASRVEPERALQAERVLPLVELGQRVEPAVPVLPEWAPSWELQVAQGLPSAETLASRVEPERAQQAERVLPLVELGQRVEPAVPVLPERAPSWELQAAQGLPSAETLAPRVGPERARQAALEGQELQVERALPLVGQGQRVEPAVPVLPELALS